MVDSRQKGARNEAALKRLLRDITGLKWERTPGSGALNEAHYLKGDLYIPNEKNYYSIEAKAYKDCHINHLLLSGKSNKIFSWWEQAVRQANQTDKIPLLMFKHDRSKWYVCFESDNPPNGDYIYISRIKAYIMLLESWLNNNEVNFI